MEQIKKYLIPLLKAVLTERISNSEINLLVKIAHHFAVIRFRQLINSQKIHIDIYPHSISALAMDCISELFRRDDEGAFREIICYFTEDKDIFRLSEEEIIQHFRILVFSKLNDGIVRLYREYDPVLSKIIRNIKIAVSKNSEVKSFCRFGSMFIYSCSLEDRNDHLPEYPIQEIESELIAKLNGKENIGDYLGKILLILNEAEAYRRFYSLIDIAVIIKKVIGRLRTQIDTQYHADYNLLNNDIENIFEVSIGKIKDELKNKYLQKGKLDQINSSAYLSAIEEMLRDIYLFNNGDNFSQFDYLKKYNSSISYENYRQTHRIQFEYMAKLAKKMMLDDMKELIN